MVLGDAATDPTPAQVQAMQGIVRQAMDEGAMGVASALIYAPGVFAKTPELIALAHAAGRCGGRYATHLRSEGDRFLASIDEAIAIGLAARTPVELHHLKVGGRENWSTMTTTIQRIIAAPAYDDRVTEASNTYIPP